MRRHRTAGRPSRQSIHPALPGARHFAHSESARGPVRQPGRRRFPVLVVALSAISISLAGSVRHPPFNSAPRTLQRTGVISIVPEVRLLPVAASEMFAGGGDRALDAGTWRPGAFEIDASRLESRIVREIPAIWSMRVRDEEELHSFDVHYRIVASDGSPDRMRLNDRSDSEIRATLEPLTPAVVLRDDDSVVIEGGAILVLDLQSVRTAGRYTGTLTVTVNHY